MNETSKIIKAVVVRERVSLKRRRVLIDAFLRIFADRGWISENICKINDARRNIFQKIRQRDRNKKSKWYFAFYEYDFPFLSLFVGIFIKESSTIRAAMTQTVCREVFFLRMTRTSRRRQQRSYIPGTRTRNLNTHVKWIHRGPSTLSAVTKPHAKRIPRTTEKQREQERKGERKTNGMREQKG